MRLNIIWQHIFDHYLVGRQWSSGGRYHNVLFIRFGHCHHTSAQESWFYLTGWRWISVFCTKYWKKAIVHSTFVGRCNRHYTSEVLISERQTTYTTTNFFLSWFFAIHFERVFMRYFFLTQTFFLANLSTIGFLMEVSIG